MSANPPQIVNLYDFAELELEEGEEYLLAACLDHEHALRITLRELGIHPFQGRTALELDRWFVWLVNGYLAGRYDELTNRDQLAARYPVDEWLLLEGFYDGNSAVEVYVEALVSALAAVREARAASWRAAMALYSLPLGFGRSPGPRKPRAAPPPWAVLPSGSISALFDD